MNILLNAEPFGFGPSAAIAHLFRELVDYPLVARLSYAGERHTLDLQRSLPYAECVSFSDKEEFIQKLKGYDLFITAMDFEKAQWAVDVGVPTIVYDALAWYWENLPTVAETCEAYIAQDFYGVRERLESSHIPKYTIVPPAVAIPDIPSATRNTILINFGGMLNPFWNGLTTKQYVSKIWKGLSAALPRHNIRVVGSADHVDAVLGFSLETLSQPEMGDLLAKTGLLLATPGLGNIYEAAAYALPSIWLPPVNDSQGRQLCLLRENGVADAFIDWEDLGFKINYKRPQPQVLSDIRYAIANLDPVSVEEVIRTRLVCTNRNVALPSVLTEFGNDGAAVLGQRVREVITRLAEKVQNG